MNESESLDLAIVDDSYTLRSLLQGSEPFGAVPCKVNICEGPREVLEHIEAQGGLYIDDDLGFVVGKRGLLEQISEFIRENKDLTLYFELAGNPILEPLSASEPESATTDACSPKRMWYIERLGGWPHHTGIGQRVAVIDSGLAAGHARHPRLDSDEDFASLEPGVESMGDHEEHGTQCAGLIGAKSTCGERIGVAPDCGLIICQKRQGAKPEEMATVHFALLLAWAVHCRHARIVSFSFGVKEAMLQPHTKPRVFSHIAYRLRKKKRALLFCAAGSRKGQMRLPAAAAGVVAVGAYGPQQAGSTSIRALERTSGLDAYPPVNRDFLLGPGVDLLTTKLPDSAGRPCVDDIGRFGGTSGACAFVAGVAALYCERFPDLDADEILQRMKDDAECVRYPDSEHVWYGVRFPTCP